MRKFLLFKSFLGLMLLSTTVVFAQERVISGKVSSSDDGTALPGVNVVLKGTSSGTSTDATGAFSLSVPASGGVIMISFIGYKSQEVEIGARTVIDVQLQNDQTQLEEVVVTGYGSTLRKEFSGVTATVTAKDIEKLPITSASQALQGQAAGVIVTQNSGAPGGGISVRVRGQTSISALNDPLYVIDGVPVVASDFTQSAMGGQVGNALAGLNPQDIQSMEVLKDAASAAIYGSRAANGVVLITTKRGTSGAAKINFSAWTGWGNPTKTLDPLTAQEFVDVRNEARVNSGLAQQTNAQLGWDGVTNTNWVKEVFRTSRISEYQLNISGGDEKTKYYVSGSWRDEEGVLLGSKYERGTLRVNLDHKASKLFSFGTSLSISADLNKRINNDNNIYGVYSAALLTPSTKAIRDENGNYIDALPSFGTNAVRDATLPRQDNRTIKAIGNFYTNFHIINGLDFRTDFSYDYNALSEDGYNPASTAQGRPTGGNGEFSYRQIGTYIVEPTLRYAKTINENHSLNAVAGLTFQNRTQIDNDVNGVTFARETLTYLNSAATINAGGSARTDYRFNSVFGRVNYAFKEKYIASATYRRDGSSRFGPSNKFGNFYAVSAGWNFSEEDFMKSMDWLSLGKLRASYGSVGNDGVTNFPWQANWNAANYLDRAAVDAGTIANSDLKWETTATLDVGIELALFNNRVNLNFGYFDRQTKDLLYNTPVPLTSGFTGVFKNIGDMSNKGFEIELSGVIVNSPSGFKWRANANGTFLQNKLTKLVGDKPILQGFGSAIIVGQPLNTFYGLKFQGVDPATGTSIFQDVNGDGKVNTVDDSQVLGKASPDFIGGFTNTFSFKGFTLDVFFNFVQGINLYNSTQTFTMVPSNGFGMTTEMRRRWRNPGDITDVPKALNAAGLNAAVNSRWVQSGDYLRLKNVTLAYDFPSALVSKIKLRSARLYVTGQNLLTFTKYQGADPEISAFANTSTAAGTDFLTQPQTKMYLVGINIGF